MTIANGARRVVARVRRRVVRPTLSVVMPCRDGGPYLEAAIRSVLNQDLRDLELIVADDGSEDGSLETVARLAGRDRRIRQVSTGGAQGPGTARNLGVSVARGRFLAFADADDLVLPGAYSTMLASLRGSGSDMVVGGYRRHGTTGSHRPRLVARVHRTGAVGTVAAATPEVLDEVVIWNRMFRADFWRSAVGPFPERGNYEDREPALRSVLRARRLDVLTEDVYSWRLPEGRTSRSQHKREVADLRDRIAVMRRELVELDDAVAIVRDRVVARWLGNDLGMYAEHVPQASDEYWAVLRDAVREVAEVAGPAAWAQVPLQDRLVAWVIAAGCREDAEELLGTRAEDSTSVPQVVGADGRLRADLEVLGRLTTPVPTELLDVAPELVEPVVGVRRVAWSGDTALRVDAWAYLPGLEPGVGEHTVRLRRVDNGVTVAATPRPDLHIDVDARDPWRTYAASGFTVDVPVEDGAPAALVVELALGHHRWSAPLKISLPARPGDDPPPAGDGDPQRVFVDDVVLDGATVAVTGWARPAPELLRLALVTSRRTFEAVARVGGDSRFTAVIEADGSAFPSDGYFLRWAVRGTGKPDGWVRAAGRLTEGPLELASESQAATVACHGEGAVSVTLRAPLTVQEQSRYGQRVLRSRPYAGPVVPAVLFETFNGKSCGDNPGALFADLRSATDVPMYWSVVDRSVPVPQGGIPVVVGSEAWHRALTTSAVLVNNNNFPHYFSKRPEQFYLQTWHGTPIKRLLWDLPRSASPLTYQRLMRRQAPMWDLLLAQSEESVGFLRSGLGYDGEILVVEQPRNAILLDGEATRRRVRAELGIHDDERVVLYAPTWRETHRTRARAGSWADELDVNGFAEEVGATVLVRSHHVSSREVARGERVKDVSNHPSVEELMLAADILVSDYSSVLHDWALLGRPAVLFAPDLAHYRDVERGFYGGFPGTSPWTLTQDAAALAEAVAGALRGDEEPVPVIDAGTFNSGLARVRSVLLEQLGAHPRATTKESA